MFNGNLKPVLSMFEYKSSNPWGRSNLLQHSILLFLQVVLELIPA